MKTYLLKYNRPNTFTFHSVLKVGEQIVGSLRFIPGVNEITEEQWEAIKSHPLLPQLFKDDYFEWVDGVSPDDKVADKAPEEVLEPLPERKAVKVVKNTLKKPLLDSWKENEKRPEVVEAIDNQLNKLKLPEKKS